MYLYLCICVSFFVCRVEQQHWTGLNCLLNVCRGSAGPRCNLGGNGKTLKHIDTAFKLLNFWYNYTLLIQLLSFENLTQLLNFETFDTTFRLLMTIKQLKIEPLTFKLLVKIKQFEMEPVAGGLKQGRKNMHGNDWSKYSPSPDLLYSHICSVFNGSMPQAKCLFFLICSELETVLSFWF